MRNKILLFTALFAFIFNASAQNSIVTDVFKEFVENKVERMQPLIGFDNNQADELKELELNFLHDVNAAENFFLCNTKKRIKKLNRERDKRLQQILTREQYIKYNAIDNNLLQKDPPIQV